MRRVNTAHDETISRLYCSGLGYTRIGAQLGLKYSTVRTTLIRLGIPRRPGPDTTCDPVRNAQINTERAAGLTLAEIGRQHGISRQRAFQLTKTGPRVTVEDLS